METILVKPRNKEQIKIIEYMFREMDIPFEKEENKNGNHVFDRKLLDKIALEVKSDFDKITDLDTFQENFKGDFYE